MFLPTIPVAGMVFFHVWIISAQVCVVTFVFFVLMRGGVIGNCGQDAQYVKKVIKNTKQYKIKGRPKLSIKKLQ